MFPDAFLAEKLTVCLDHQFSDSREVFSYFLYDIGRYNDNLQFLSSYLHAQELN